jgi:AcrR family transcriptional regulator
MAPRAYRLGKREAQVEGTRRRIVDAVVRLHSELGIVATTYEAIAEAADVAVATVYRHFPSLDELVPACGNRIMEITQPPGPNIFDGKETLEERVRAFVSAIFDFWLRARSYLERPMADADRVPVLAQRLEMQTRLIETLARQALGESADDGDALRLLLALTDLRAWMALADHGLAERAPEIVSGIVLSRMQKEA